MKIGIYGGAFNPVHNGHLNLARYFLESAKLDKILFIPTANPPHRSREDFAAKKDRVEMLSLALADEPKFEISLIEFEQNEKSYTYNTIRNLRKTYPNDELFLIMGADQFLCFDTWFRAKDILKDVTILTGARCDETERQRMENAKDTQPIFENANVVIANLNILPMSSNEVRRRIANGESIENCVAKKVYSYIMEKGLYYV